MKRRLILALALLAVAAFTIAGGAAASGHGQWWHHTLPNDKTVCNQSNTEPNQADAGPFESKADCKASDGGGGGGEDNWAITLNVFPNPDTPGGDLTLNGFLTKNGGTSGTGSQPVSIVEFFDSECSDTMATVTGATTNGVGGYLTTLTDVTSIPGDYYLAAESNGVQSNCVDVVIGDGEGGGGHPVVKTVDVRIDHAYLCYSVGGNPRVAETESLNAATGDLAAGQWAPSAVLGHNDQGENFGPYTLVCKAPDYGPDSLFNAPLAAFYADGNGQLHDAFTAGLSTAGQYPVVTG